jgi:DHA1 family multidrug resistance protein-like MFS transporter
MAAAEGVASGQGSSWKLLAAVFAVVMFVELMGFGHFYAFTPLYLAQLGLAPADVPVWTGILAAISFALGLPLAPLWGVWADKYSRKLIIVRSAVGEILIFGIAAASQNVWHLLLARMLTGLLLGNTGVMYAVLSETAPRERIAFAIALVQMGGTLGMTVGPLIGGALIPYLGLAGLFALDSALSVATAVLLLVVYREVRRERRETRSVTELLRALPATLLTSPLVLPLYGVQVLLLLGTHMSTPFVPLLVGELYTGDDLPLAIGILMSSFGVASALCAVVWGRVGDRFGRLPVLQATVVLSALALLALALAPSWEALLVARTLQGVFQAAAPPLIVALIATHTPETVRASVLNLYMIPFYVAAVTGGALGGALAALGIRVVFAGAAASTLVANGAIAWLGASGRLAPAEEAASAER